jgi:hypothetical protein
VSESPCTRAAPGSFNARGAFVLLAAVTIDALYGVPGRRPACRISIANFRKSDWKSCSAIS